MNDDKQSRATPKLLPPQTPITPHPMGLTTEHHHKKSLYIAMALLVALIIAAGLVFATFSFLGGQKTANNQAFEHEQQVSQTPDEVPAEAVKPSSGVDATKLPLGDKKISSSPKQGYVYSCQVGFAGNGASAKGPWINTAAGTWDATKKAKVDGNVAWPNASFSLTPSGSSLKAVGNGLPKTHATGTYPIASADDAYTYDRNPNSIKSQTIGLNLPANPVVAATPECVGGEVGITLSGVPLFSAFDAGGNDAVALEVQDSCGGHPQKDGLYHYHGHVNCLADNQTAGAHSDVQAYAFDGFGIYGVKGQDGKELSTKDLDECHGHTHSVAWNGKQTSIYHYHMTRDFPYTVGCFKGKAAVKSVSQQAAGGTAGQTSPQPGGSQPPKPGGVQPPPGMPQ